MVQEYEVTQDDKQETETVVTDINDDVNNEQRLRKETMEENKELENLFNQQLQCIKHSTMLELELREKLGKLKLPAEIEESANRILDRYLCGADTIPEITGKVYAVGKATELEMEIAQAKERDQPKRRLTNGNRRERSLKAEMKE